MYQTGDLKCFSFLVLNNDGCKEQVIFIFHLVILETNLAYFQNKAHKEKNLIWGCALKSVLTNEWLSVGKAL